MSSPANRVSPLFGLMAISSLAIGLGSLRYLIPDAPGLAPNVLANRFVWTGALTLHAGLAAIALISGPFQFLSGLRRTQPGLHRILGRVYVVACLVSGLGGLFLAFGASTGPISTAGFGTLAVLWIYANGRAWQLALDRRFKAHEQWMVRSFAMTFGAVTLRLYLPLAFVGPWTFEDAYRAISFLSWVPNLLLAEIFIRTRLRSSPARG